MSFYILPTPWDPRYALPDYVQAEPPGRGTFTTKGPRRGTIQSLIPDPLSGDCAGGGCACRSCQRPLAADMSTWIGPAIGGVSIPIIPIAIGVGVLCLLTRRK